MKASRLLVTGIGELCTCDPAQGAAPGILRDAAVLAGGPTITWVGPEAELPDELRRSATETIDAGGACVIPGFVDAHTHLVFAGSRADEFAARAAGESYLAVGAEGGGIASTVRATTIATDEGLRETLRRRLDAATARGTTTVEVKTGYGGGVADELRLLDVIVELASSRRGSAGASITPTFLALHGHPPGGDEDHVAGVLAAIPQLLGRTAFVDVFCDPAGWDVESCARVLHAAEEAGLGLKVHAEQTARTGGAMLAAQYGAASADHLEHATREDAVALAGAGVVGVLLPGTTLSMRSQPPDARMLAAAGVELALATDCNPGTSYTLDMRLVVALGVGLLGLTPAEALVAATRGGASALDLDDRGALSPGRRCDLVVLDADTHVDVAYRLGDVRVTRVFVQGAEVALPGE